MLSNNENRFEIKTLVCPHRIGWSYDLKISKSGVKLHDVSILQQNGNCETGDPQKEELRDPVRLRTL